MVGIINNLGLIKRSQYTGRDTPLNTEVRHYFTVTHLIPSDGPITLMWHDEHGINYVASCHVRAEFDPEYNQDPSTSCSSLLISDEKKIMENSISESMKEKNEDEEWI